MVRPLDRDGLGARVTDFNAQVIEEFRANRGVVGGPLQGAPLVLVTHRGAKTGTRRTNPLGYFDDGDQLILFASAMGAPSNPAWYHNLAAHPRVTVELGEDEFEADALVLEGADRSAAWQRLIAARPFLVEHQKTAGDREIPLIALRRVA